MAESGFDIHLDEVTLAGAKRGDMRACEKIYRSYHTAAYTLAARICKCRELAKEVTQEAFITAFKRVPQFRGDSPFWGWLRRVVINHAISSMPAESVIYVAELEDLIAQVDNELSFTPDSIDLWGQRVNLLLDLAQIYQQQWQIDYGRMAAL